MKKILFISLLLLPSLIFAANVSPQQAQMVAERFFAGAGATRSSAASVQLKWTGDNLQTRASQDAAFYVFDNTAGGFVVVSGDDRIEPVLGYSLDGEFRVEGMPDNVKYWFKHLQDGVSYLRSHDIPASAKVRARWQAFETGAVTRGGSGVGGGRQLTTAKWDQEHPYNLKATEWCNFGVEVVTGCVATATAIIMRYHKHPVRGTGELESYQYRYNGVLRTVNGYKLGHEYDWDNMPLAYMSNATSAEKNAVAQLMLDCGVMVGMLYGQWASAASTSNVEQMLIDHMGYDRSADVLDRDMYTTDVWIERIVANIDANCPVLFSAQSAENSGHAFVLDGYDNAKNIHINWGWGGYDDGYYTVPDFGEYKYDQAAYVNIKPDEGGSYPESVIGFSDQNGVNGLAFTSGPNISSSGVVSMNFATGLIYNMGAAEAAVDIIIAHADKNDNIKSRIREASRTWPPGYGTYWPDIYYSVSQEQIDKGDKIKVFYQYPGGDIKAVWYKAGMTGELPLPSRYDDVFDIENGTSVRYDSAAKMITVTTSPSIEWSLAGENGAKVTSGVSFDAGVLTIDTTALRAGVYTLRLAFGSSSKELQFKVGEKNL